MNDREIQLISEAKIVLMRIFIFTNLEIFSKIYLKYFHFFSLRLWNCNNPNDEIEDNGIYDETIVGKRILMSPVDGFEFTCQ